MNNKKIIEHFMMKIIETADEILEEIRDFKAKTTNTTKISDIIIRNSKNITYYAKLIIEKDGAL